MATKQAENAEQLRGRIEHLSGEVQRLQHELGDAHSADYNTLKRAYVSLVQHFRALQIEAQVLKAHIDALDVEVMNPDEVANELTAVAAVAAVATVAGRVLRHPGNRTLRLAIWSASALFLGWRFTTAGFSRMGSLLVRNRQRKRRLQQDWESLTERIRIMDELTRWEGQDPALQPPGASSGPSSDGSGASGWVDVSQADQEAEGRITYPKPYSPAATAATAQDDGEGIVSYPQAHASQATEEAADGAVAYPSLAEAAAKPAKKSGGGGGQLRAEDLPTAPPLPAGAAAEKEERQRVPAMRAA
jgi:chaperonin cofactor prefoldin